MKSFVDSDLMRVFSGDDMHLSGFISIVWSSCYRKVSNEVLSLHIHCEESGDISLDNKASYIILYIHNLSINRQNQFDLNLLTRRAVVKGHSHYSDDYNYKK